MQSANSRGNIGGHVLIYGAGNFFVALLNFWLFSLYAHALKPEDYGAMSLIVTLCSIVSMLGMMGMNNAVQRFFFEEAEPAARRRVWVAGFAGGVALTLGLVLLAGLGLALWGERQPGLAGPAPRLALAAVVPQAMVIWLQERARLEFRPWRYTALAAAQGAVAGGVGIYLVVFRHWGLAGFFSGSLLAATLAAGGAFFTTGDRNPMVFSRREFVRLARFGAPFVPAGVFIWLSSAVLKWMIVHFKGLAEGGIFEVAWKLAVPVWMLNAAVGQAFGPYAFRLQAEAPDYRAKLVKALQLIGAVTLVICCVVILFAREICLLMAPAAYARAAGPCGILAMGFYFSATHQVTALGIAFAQRPKLIAVGWGAAAGLSLLLAFWLVPAFGASGAAWCMVGVYGGLSAYYVGCTQRLHPLPFHWGALFVQLGAGFLTLGVAWVVDARTTSLAGAAIKLAWLSVAVAGLAKWGGVDWRALRAHAALWPSFNRWRPRSVS